MLFIDKNEEDEEITPSLLISSASTSSILTDIQKEKAIKEKKSKKDRRDKRKGKRDKKSKRNKNIINDQSNESENTEEFKKIKVIEPKNPANRTEINSYLSMTSNLTIHEPPIQKTSPLLGRQSTMPLHRIPPPLFPSSLGNQYIGSRIPPPISLKTETDDNNNYSDDESDKFFFIKKNKRYSIKETIRFFYRITFIQQNASNNSSTIKRFFNYSKY